MTIALLIQIIMAIVSALPQIISLVKEIIDLIRNARNPQTKSEAMDELKSCIQQIRKNGLRPDLLDRLHALRDKLKRS